ncbi:MAG: hypothetical protein JWP97_573 [Labilithrix sp.]|nr:hypothetical protein [Labilithrix sp.]
MRRLLPFSLGLAGLAAVTILATPGPAHAVAAPPCAPATITPRAAAVPANFPGFAYTASQGTAADVHLKAGGEAQAVVVTPGEGGLLKVTTVKPLAAGTSYSLDWEKVCTYGITPPPEPFSFTVTPEAPLPTTLGAAPAAPSVSTRDLGSTAFTITTSVTLAPEMKPWLAAYQLLVLLDGRLVATKATPGDGDTVALVADGWCDQAFASRSDHKVSVRGRLTFAPTVETPPVDLTFACPAPKVAVLPSDPATPPPGVTPRPASTVGVTPGTAGTTGGCATAPGARDTSFAALGLGALALVSALARRRASAATRRT